jgi:hypothetical protein
VAAEKSKHGDSSADKKYTRKSDGSYDWKANYPKLEESFAKTDSISVKLSGKDTAENTTLEPKDKEELKEYFEKLNTFYNEDETICKADNGSKELRSLVRELGELYHKAFIEKKELNQVTVLYLAKEINRVSDARSKAVDGKLTDAEKEVKESVEEIIKHSVKAPQNQDQDKLNKEVAAAVTLGKVSFLKPSYVQLADASIKAIGDKEATKCFAAVEDKKDELAKNDATPIDNGKKEEAKADGQKGGMKDDKGPGDMDPKGPVAAQRPYMPTAPAFDANQMLQQVLARMNQDRFQQDQLAQERQAAMKNQIDQLLQAQALAQKNNLDALNAINKNDNMALQAALAALGKRNDNMPQPTPQPPPQITPPQLPMAEGRDNGGGFQPQQQQPMMDQQPQFAGLPNIPQPPQPMMPMMMPQTNPLLNQPVGSTAPVTQPVQPRVDPGLANLLAQQRLLQMMQGQNMMVQGGQMPLNSAQMFGRSPYMGAMGRAPVSLAGRGLPGGAFTTGVQGAIGVNPFARSTTVPAALQRGRLVR